MHDHKSKNILMGILLNGSFTILELVVGIFSNSLALMSDALHDFTDTLALCMAWFAQKQSHKEPDLNKTWGYHRATILSAFINGTVLFVLTIFIFYRAIDRIFNPEPVDGLLMMGVSVIGFSVNGLVAFNLWRTKDRDLNITSIFWHMAEDALGWTGVLISGVVIWFTGFYMIDPLVSILIGLIVIRGAWQIISESTNILLEAVPKDVDINAFISSLKHVDEVNDIHDMHVWTIGSQLYAASAHAVVDEMNICDTNKILHKLESVAKDFNITHLTIAFESNECAYNNGH